MTTDHQWEEHFQQMKAAVFARRPFLQEVVRQQGTKSLFEYSRDYFSVNINPPIQERQDELIGTLKQEIEKRLGPDIAKSAAKQLREYYFVSTADHHGPLCSPFFLNSNMVIASSYFDESMPTLENVIVLSCANVSLNNSSFPRGLLFQTAEEGKVQLHRLSFLPSNAHSAAVYNFRPYTGQEVQKIRSLLRQKTREGHLKERECGIISSLIDEIYDQKDVLACPTYSDQVMVTNDKLWKEYFSSPAKQVPNLITLEQEGFVARLLLDYHIDFDTTVSRMLFQDEYEPLVHQYFEGIMGAFSREAHWGTHFFWGVSADKNFRVQLWKQGNELVSNDGSMRIPLTPAGIRQALEEKKMIPSMLLIFTVLCFYYGLKCLGGFNQVNYLTQMKNAYIKMEVDTGQYKSIEVCARAQTKELCDGLTVAFLEAPDGSLTPAMGLDLILYGNESTRPTLLDVMKNLTFEEALNPLMPEFYRIVYPETERDPELLSITSKEITARTGIDKKIRPCATVRGVDA
jgi:hypothetical protein